MIAASVIPIRLIDGLIDQNDRTTFGWSFFAVLPALAVRRRSVLSGAADRHAQPCIEVHSKKAARCGLCF